MANNWIESYLEALLSQGLSTEHLKKASDAEEVISKVDAERKVAAKYYVQQILEMDEVALWNSWSRLNATRILDEKERRLRILVWRVWFMKQKKILVDEENSLLEDDTYSVELSENSEDSIDEDAEASILTRTSLQFLPTFTEPQNQQAEERFHTRIDKLYVILISMHGLIRGEAMELGRDADTGGQVKYVVELAKELGRHPTVHRVDLMTRQIIDPSVDAEYGQAEECLEKGEGEYGGSYIVRLPCGPPKYIQKERLWPHVREFADMGLIHARGMLNDMAEAKEPCELYYVHGHYADAGEVAAMMSRTLGVDMVLTGHSLGRNKLEHLLAAGKLTLADIEANYSISRRIEAEERSLDEAVMVFTSTLQEIEEQWGLYNGYNREMLYTIRRRFRSNYHMPLMKVVPPGLDFRGLQQDLESHHPGHELDDDWSTPNVEHPEPRIWSEVFKFLRNPRKPVILALSRPDPKKNITTLVKAFGENETLREVANLVLIMGNRDVIDSLPKGSKGVLMDVIRLIDDYDLYGSVAYPKRHRQDQVKDIYALASRSKGIFINPALQEPFGLTLIEAAACGAPIVATKNGGPVDIIGKLKNGILVDPLDEKEIGDALLRILTEKGLWEECRSNGLKNICAYSWTAHCNQVLKLLDVEKSFQEKLQHIAPTRNSWDESFYKSALNKGDHNEGLAMDDQTFHRDPEYRMLEEELDARAPPISFRSRLIVVSVDNIPLGNQSLELLKRIISKAYGSNSQQTNEGNPFGFGIASMLSFDATCSMIEEFGIKLQDIDFFICNGGADLFVTTENGEQMAYEPYETHIENRWDKEIVKRALERLSEGRNKTEIVRLVDEYTGPTHIVMEVQRKVERVNNVTVVDRVRSHLRRSGIRVTCTLQVDETEKGAQVSPLLHITPIRATRSLALRFLAHRMRISMKDIDLMIVASSIKDKEPSKPTKAIFSVGFVTNDADYLIGGAQQVIIVPPSDATAVRIPKDRLDEQMIQKLTLNCGPDIYHDRVVVLSENEKIEDAFARLVPGFKDL